MCISQIRYFNKWSHSWQYQKCGKCAACQQEKAFKRTQRIKNATYEGYIPLFVTLTYRNFCIPYIRKSEIKENVSYINIYRDCHVRRVRVRSDYAMAYKIKRQTFLESTVDCFENRIFPNLSDVSRLPKLKGESDTDKVGVLYYADIQNFEKRLRINLERRYQIIKPIYSFKCSELGPSTQRPHFHLLIYVPQESLAQCTHAISEAWPYASRVRMRESIEIARNASSYVSSYVNRGSDFPTFFANRQFRPKHSFSKGFGLQNPAFNLTQLIGSIRCGDLSFITERNRNGTKELVSILYPKYFLNYYFGKFLGYSRLTYDEIIDLVKRPGSIYQENAYLIDKLQIYTKDINPFTGLYDIDHEKIRALISHINLRYYRFISDFNYFDDDKECFGLPDNSYSRELFADYYYRVWTTYASNIYRKNIEKARNERELIECYYNLDEVRKFRFRSDIWSILWKFKETDPNRYVSNLVSTNNMRSIFSRMYKRRKVTNKSMADQGLYV